MKRCDWCLGNKLYEDYHDNEWGVPCYDDGKLFEFLVLESAQAGLSWITILKKRENYREAYDGFDVEKVSKYNEDKILELLNNSGVIRNRQKIVASINNANRFIEVQKEFGSFSNYLWGFVDGVPIINDIGAMEQIPAKTEVSDALFKDLKARGFKFLGSVTLYAYIQSMGLVNDHLVDCDFRKV